MLKTTTFFAGLIFLGVFSQSAFAASPRGNELPSDAALDAELQKQELALLIAPIKSKSDLDDFLAHTPRKHSPFSLLSRAGQKQFIDSLTFGERGLSGFNYTVIESELSYSAAYRVLSLFGMQHLAASLTRAKVETGLDAQIKSSAAQTMMMTDYKEYRCASHGTCSKSAEQICTSNC